jgi:hypothetical protein
MLETLQEARRNLRAAMQQKGELPHCPCCDQVAKIYRRSINSNMAEALVVLYRYCKANPQEEWIDVPSILRANPRRYGGTGEWGGDYAKLRFWNILQPMDALRADGSNRSGKWKLTYLGKQFAKAEIRLPKYTWVYNNENLERECDEFITIRGVQHFNYEEMIQGS